MNTIRLYVLPALLIVALAGTAEAQTSGKVAGEVTDAESGEPIIGANVAVKGTTQGASTDADGYYAILNVSPGTRVLRVSFIGYGTKVVENVRVKIDQTTEVNVQLSQQTVEGEEVTVTAKRPIVERDLTSTSESISSDELEALPVQNFNDVVNLQAGVVGGHFRGGRAGEVAYQVDGLPVNDVYDQSYAFQVENNAVQEVKVITGTFNAEYGQAQSGVVSIVTKEAGEEYEGNVEGYVGDYVTTHTDLYDHLGDVSPAGLYEVQGSLGGPVVPGWGRKITFFASGRYVRNGGYLYGRRVVKPVYADEDNGQGERLNVRGDSEVFVPELGDSSFVSMNWNRQATGQLKLTSRLFGGDKLSINGLLQSDRGQDYHPLFRYNPEGVPTTYGDSWSAMATYSRVFSSKTFLDLKGGFFRNGTETYLYKDPLDPRYPSDRALRRLGGNYSFYRGGALMNHFDRETDTYVGSLDLTSQVTRRHQVQTGAEVRRHQLELNEFEVKNNPSTGGEPSVPPSGTPDHVRYEHTPLEAGAYAQDKIEFDYLVINAGLRLDYFDPQAKVLNDFGRPQSSPRADADVKWQLSPRLGLSYPISEQGAVRVAYGHFFQMPSFQYLYTNPDYIYDPEEGLSRPFGYADLEPQKTVSYEIGLQQAFTSTIGMDLAVYYKDIRNLLSTRIETIQRGFGEPFPLSHYGRFVNRDYGQVKGVTVAFEKRMSNGYSVSLNYTFQIAKGNASDPRNRLLDEQEGTETEKQLVPLDWDRRHQLNFTATVGSLQKGLVSIVGQLGSGMPYTPSVASQRTGTENSARKPATLSFDLYGKKTIEVGGLRPGLFLRVYNLFDTRNVQNVYTDTGRTDPNLRYYPGEPQGLNTKAEFLERPDFYAPPRRIMIGAALSL